jgi:hypothetical protein
MRYLAAAASSASGSGQPRFAYSTTPQYLQIATNFRESGPQIVLPVADAREAGAADAQIWWHESLGRNDRVVAAIDFLNPALSMSDFLKAVSVTARIIGGT